MDFKITLGNLINKFQKERVQYALIGGFALGALGISKATEELLRLARSDKFKNEMRRLREHRFNPLIIRGRVDLDRLIEFFNGYNEFINHEPKPFKPIIDKNMKL